MTDDKRYRSDELRSLHRIARDLYAVGAIDEAQMRLFDSACQSPDEPSCEVKQGGSAMALEHTMVRAVREIQDGDDFVAKGALGTIICRAFKNGELASYTVEFSGPDMPIVACAYTHEVELLKAEE